MKAIIKVSSNIETVISENDILNIIKHNNKTIHFWNFEILFLAPLDK